MCSTIRRVEGSLLQIILVTAVVASGLGALACVGDGPSGGGRKSVTPGNPIAPSPSGPHALRGVVTDAGGMPLSGAKVAVSIGTWSLTSVVAPVVTGTDGRFETGPVEGEVFVHVARPGYRSVERTVTASSDQLAFQLQRLAPNTLVVTASPSCALPEEARSRDYAVQLEDRNGAIVVRVTDADGVPYAAELGFVGARDGGHVTFTLVDNAFGGDWAFVELVNGPKVEFALSGTAAGVIAETGISATFDGRVQVRSWTNTYTIAECQASDHRLEIVQ